MARTRHARTVRRTLAAAAALAPALAGAAGLAQPVAEGSALRGAGPAAFWFLPLVVTVAVGWRFRSRRGREETLAAPRDGSWLDATSLFPGDADGDR